MIIGVSEGFTKELEIVGVGYRASREGQQRPRAAARLQPPGQHHAPEGIEFEVPEQTQIIVKGSTSSWSARSPPTSASGASPSPTRARASGTPASASSARPERRRSNERICRQERATRIRRHDRVRKRSTAPQHVRAWPCSAPTSTSRRRSSTTTPVSRSLRSTTESTLRCDGRGNSRRGHQGRRARGRAGQGRRHQHGRVRPRRHSLPRSCRRAGRRRPRGRTGVLMAYEATTERNDRATTERGAARVARHQHQPCRQGRQGWPSLLLHRTRGDRRRQRPGRPRLRQGQGGAPGDPEGHRRSQAQPVHVPLAGTTIVHPVIGQMGAGRVMMKPAAPGTGVIAGGAARVILEEAGMHDVLCKSLGSPNHINVARATIAGLKICSVPTRSRSFAASTPRSSFPQVCSGVQGEPSAMRRRATAGRQGGQ